MRVKTNFNKMKIFVQKNNFQTNKGFNLINYDTHYFGAYIYYKASVRKDDSWIKTEGMNIEFDLDKLSSAFSVKCK